MRRCFNGAAPVRTRIVVAPGTVKRTSLSCFNGAAPVRTRIVGEYRKGEWVERRASMGPRL